jgi:hypothetical protein
MAMEPRLRVELERARREARERQLRLIQAALGRTPRDAPVDWVRRFEGPPRGSTERNARRKT